tara:strand:+ start:47 stop:277 length:231 start_codon:yes stop_codon:yes gene_type:complete
MAVVGGPDTCTLGLSLWFFRARVHIFMGHEKKKEKHHRKPIYVCTYFQPQASFSPAYLFQKLPGLLMKIAAEVLDT